MTWLQYILFVERFYYLSLSAVSRVEGIILFSSLQIFFQKCNVDCGIVWNRMTQNARSERLCVCVDRACLNINIPCAVAVGEKSWCCVGRHSFSLGSIRIILLYSVKQKIVFQIDFFIITYKTFQYCILKTIHKSWSVNFAGHLARMLYRICIGNLFRESRKL